ncbi:MAG: Trm112 family protein [Acidobacteriota bacterium]
MAVDPDLLDILICPESKGELELVTLPDNVCTMLVEKYREPFRDEEPTVEQGLYCEASQLVYPIVSDIPMMLKDEALSASVIGRGPAT